MLFSLTKRTMTRPILCALFVVLALVGCKPAPGGASIDGMVTLDGQPVANGLIHFEPAGESGVNASRRIADGHYNFPPKAMMQPGLYKVSIQSIPPESGLDPDAIMNGAPVPAFKDPIPAKYRTNSDLVAEVSAEGPNTFNFELKTGR